MNEEINVFLSWFIGVLGFNVMWCTSCNLYWWCIILSMNLKNTLYGDLERIVNRYYDDVHNLTNLVRYTKNKESVDRYKKEIDKCNAQINFYEKRMNDIYNQWNKDMMVISKFGDFFYLVENDKSRRILY